MKRIIMTIGIALVVVMLFGCVGSRIERSPVHFKQFPIGVFSAEPKNDQAMKRLKRAGFNYIQSYSTKADEIQDLMKLAAKHNLKVMFYLNKKLVRDENGLSKMRKIVRQYRHHPALGFWLLYDEPSIKINVPPKALAPFYQMLKKEAPDVPVAIITCWDESWYKYSRSADIQMIDMYPVRDEEFPKAPLQYFTTFLKQAKALGVPIMSVPQLMCWKAFDYQLKGKGYKASKYRYPNEAELRYLIHAPMTLGVCGVFGFSYYHATVTGGNASWFDGVCAPVGRELRQFCSDLQCPDKPVNIKRAEDANFMGAYWQGKKHDYVMIVNSWPLERPRVDIWLEGCPVADQVLKTFGRTRHVKARIKNGRIKIDGSVKPWEVFIFQLKPGNNPAH